MKRDVCCNEEDGTVERFEGGEKEDGEEGAAEITPHTKKGRGNKVQPQVQMRNTKLAREKGKERHKRNVPDERKGLELRVKKEDLQSVDTR